MNLDSEVERYRRLFLDMYKEMQEIVDENLVFEFRLKNGSWSMDPDDTIIAVVVWHTDHGELEDGLDFTVNGNRLLLDGPIENLPLVFDQLMPIAEAIATIRLKRGY